VTTVDNVMKNLKLAGNFPTVTSISRKDWLRKDVATFLPGELSHLCLSLVERKMSACEVDDFEDAEEERPRFAVGDLVFADYEPKHIEGAPKLLYEAKIIKINKEKEKLYRVHYQGWKKTWDENKPSSQIHPHTEFFKKLAKEREEELRVFNIKNSAAIKLAAQNASGTKRKRKSDRGDDVDDEDESDEDILVENGEDDDHRIKDTDNIFHMKWTQGLAKLLYKDYEFVTHYKMLTKLPRKPSVENILHKFFEDCCGKSEEEKVIIKGTLTSLQVMFETCIKRDLLYEFELLQRDSLPERFLSSNKSGCNILRRATIYGAEHLLRLLMMLPRLITKIDLFNWELHKIGSVLQDLLLFMHKDRSKLFDLQANYEQASAEYIALALSYSKTHK